MELYLISNVEKGTWKDNFHFRAPIAEDSFLEILLISASHERFSSNKTLGEISNLTLLILCSVVDNDVYNAINTYEFLLEPTNIIY